MQSLSTRQQLGIGTALFLTMIVTRGQHWASLESLPDASWAVFFLAGVYLRSLLAFPALCVLAAGLDYVAITFGGVSSFCISPAYGFLLPAYGALWLAGRWYGSHHRDHWTTLMPLSLSVLTGVTACELISSGGFYFFSGRFADTTLIEFGTRLARYLPMSLQTVIFYVAVAAVAHAIVTVAAREIARIGDRRPG